MEIQMIIDVALFKSITEYCTIIYMANISINYFYTQVHK